MGKLNPEQLDRIETFLDQQGLTFKPLRDEMTDHLIGDLEAHKDQGNSFDEAWDLVLSNIPDHQLQSVQREVMETIENRFMGTLVVNRRFYLFGIFFLGLYITVGLIQSLLYFQVGAQVFTLQSFVPWFVLATIISFTGSLTLLKYYHYKKYWFAFSSGTIATIASLYHFVIVYNILVARELESLFTPAYLITLGTVILYAINLIFSNAGKRPWLKAAGFFTFLLGLALVSTFIWNMNTQDVWLKGVLPKVHQWTSLAGSLIFVLYIMNFLSERKILETESIDTTQPRAQKNLMEMAGVIALMSTLFLGIMVVTESSGASAWHNRGPEHALELAQPFEAQTYVSSKGATMQYRLLKPLDYDSKRKYPLVVSLHGGGGRGTDNVIQIEGSWTAQMLSKTENRENYPAFIFVPQCPPGSTWGGIPNQPSVDSLVFEAIDALEKEFKIDVKRRYVMGESLGGYGSWHFICTRPKMFAAAVPICGGGDPNLAKNIVDVPVWAFHGAKDRSVPVRYSRDMIEAIKNAGGNPRYKEFPNEGHIISESFTETSGLLDWLFAQKRD